MDKQITITYGPANSVTLPFPQHFSVGDIVRDERVKVALRYGEGVRALIDRVEQPNSAPVENGDIIALERLASTKGV